MNRNYKYSNNSTNKINTTKDLMQLLCAHALKIACERKMHCPDFGISHGLRTIEEQTSLYTQGRKLVDNSWVVVDKSKVVTNCDGIRNRSVHQDGLAIDFYAYVDGKANYEPGNLSLIATCFFEAASDLGINIDWGGSFKSISDGCHIEIVS